MMNIGTVRSRSSYRKLSSRYGRNGRSKSAFWQMILRQILISVLILLIISIVKRIDTPFTNYIINGIKYSIVQNYEITYVYQGIDELLNKLPLKGSGTKKDDEFEQEAVSASTNEYTRESILESSIMEDVTSEIRESGESDTLEVKSDTSEVKKEEKIVTTPLFIMPAAGKIGSDFGERVDPFTKAVKVHKGIDIEASNGDPIKAALGGTVIEAGYEKTFGNYLKISHSDGYTTLYAHCSGLNVKKGQTVKQGDLIGRVGNTGASMGYHVHFEVRKNGTQVNPLPYLQSANR